MEDAAFSTSRPRRELVPAEFGFSVLEKQLLSVVERDGASMLTPGARAAARKTSVRLVKSRPPPCRDGFPR